MKNSIKCISTLFILVFLASWTNAYSNTPNEQSFEDQIKNSDIVIIGVAGRRKTLLAKNQFGSKIRIQITYINVMKVLKGTTSSTLIKLVTRADVSDLDPQCCRIGGKYIFALKRGNDDIYEVYNGRFSSIRI